MLFSLLFFLKLSSISYGCTYFIQNQDDLISSDPEAWQQLAEAMTPSIVKVVEFAKNVPGFIQVRHLSLLCNQYSVVKKTSKTSCSTVTIAFSK